jgi:hypothetical protein
MGVPCSPKALIERFEAADHFETYPYQRIPSVTVNSNVLYCLCLLSRNGEYGSSIEKCARYICKVWWETDGVVEDPWVRTNAHESNPARIANIATEPLTALFHHADQRSLFTLSVVIR